MKRKFNISRIAAFLLAFTMLFILCIQDSGSLVRAENLAGNEVSEGEKDANSIKTDNSFAGDAIWQVGESAYDSFSDASMAAGESGTIVLLGDVTLTETIVIDTKVSLDLNGHVISRGATDRADGTEAADNNVITIGTGGDLTIADSDSKAVHTGMLMGDGLWHWTKDGSGETTISGGIITGGRARTSGGGIVVNGGGRLTMTGGTIAGNRSDTYSGGGLRIDLGNATLTDVDVCYNTAVNGGGLYSTDMLSVEGGSILHNTATSDGGGVGVWGGTTMLKNVTLNGNNSGNASRNAIYVMNDNSRLNLKGASTKIDGTVTASTNVSDRIHLSNKLRWNGNMVEAIVHTAAKSASGILGTAGIAVGKILTFSCPVDSVVSIVSAVKKVSDPIRFFASRTIRNLKQAIMSLQKMILPVENMLSRIRTMLHQQLARLPSQFALLCRRLSKLPSLLPRQPSELLETELQLPRPPSQVQNIPNLLPRLPSQIAKDCPIAQTAGFGYNINIVST
jgi:hypothetical protein